VDEFGTGCLLALAAMPDWTLVLDLERAAGETAQARERECEAEIERLRAALEGLYVYGILLALAIFWALAIVGVWVIVR